MAVFEKKERRRKKKKRKDCNTCMPTFGMAWWESMLTGQKGCGVSEVIHCLTIVSCVGHVRGKESVIR